MQEKNAELRQIQKQLSDVERDRHTEVIKLRLEVCVQLNFGPNFVHLVSIKYDAKLLKLQKQRAQSDQPSSTNHEVYRKVQCTVVSCSMTVEWVSLRFHFAFITPVINIVRLILNNYYLPYTLAPTKFIFLLAWLYPIPFLCSPFRNYNTKRPSLITRLPPSKHRYRTCKDSLQHVERRNEYSNRVLLSSNLMQQDTTNVTQSVIILCNVF